MEVTNTGKRDGAEVVQVYVKNPADADGPVKTLRGFARIDLKAGERRRVEISMPRERFEGWDATTNTMRVKPGNHLLMVGSSSRDADLQTISVSIK